jgi:anti-anti-sigma factor
MLDALDPPLASADDLSSPPGLSVTADPGRRACRLFLTGALDVDTLPLFTSCLASWVGRGQSHIVVDLTAVTAVDAAGAGALARAAHVLERSGGSLSVLARDELAQGPLAGCGLDLVSSNDPDDHIVIGVRHGG